MRSSWQTGAGLSAVLLGVLLSAPAHGQSVIPKVSCESLAKLTLPDTTVTMAQVVQSGEFQEPPRANGQGRGGRGPGGPGGGRGRAGGGGMGNFNPPVDPKSMPDFCRIAATLRPTSDSEIRIEVWLPVSKWNGKFMGIGSGGMAGNIGYTGVPTGLEDAVSRGYAAATTDAGHDSTKESIDGIFLLNHPEKMIDFSYRANHLMTVEGKAFLTAYYGAGPSKSYFMGCSLGSLQAMNEVKRYPEDYDGVVSGAPMTSIGDFNAAQLWPSVLIARDPSKFIPPAKYQMIHEAVLNTCGTELDRKQGFLEDAESCHFDPGSLLCKGGDQPDCLTAPQAELLRQIYAGPVNPRTGKSIFLGPAPGAERELTNLSGSTAHSSSLALYRYEIEKNADWDWKKMDFDKDVALADKVLGPLMYVPPSSVTPFLNRGGKLLLYIGWEDYHNPRETAAYYKEVVQNAGPAKKDSIRLFEVPGMGHCVGGDGCDAFDKAAAIDQWVETGKAPDQLFSAKLGTDGKTIMSRPLCAYPKVAKYKGAGSMDDAENFVCATN